MRVEEKERENACKIFTRMLFFKIELKKVYLRKCVITWTGLNNLIKKKKKKINRSKQI